MKSIAKLTSILFLFTFVLYGESTRAFPFAYPEIELVESEFEEGFKSEISTVFDINGNVHAVWADARFDGGMQKMYGNTILRDRNPIGSYLVFGEDEEHEYTSPVVLSSEHDPNTLYSLGVRISSDPNRIVLARHNLNLPASVNTEELGTFTFPSPGPFYTDLNAVWTDHMLIFVFIAGGQILYGSYDTNTNNWSSWVSITEPGFVFSNLSMALDSFGYIYLSYNKQNETTFENFLVTRRSIDVSSVSAGFYPERMVTQSFEPAPYKSVIAATGIELPYATLRVSIAYTQEFATSPELICVTEIQGFWDTPAPFGQYSTDITFGASFISALDMDYDKAGRIYVVWAQDDFLFGSISHNTGQTFGAMMPLGPSNLDGRISLGLGYISGNVALTYNRYHITPYAVPFALVAMSDVFDACDEHPSETGFWNGWDGVALDTFNFHGDMFSHSPEVVNPASYQLTTESLESDVGLLKDYGNEEHQGILELYFYDSLTTEADFSIGFNNANLRNVIRMLGVRNDIYDGSENSYHYFDGDEWIELADRAQPGWRHVIVTVSDEGMLVQIEEVPETGIYKTHLDETFTSFTSIQIEGGSDSDPYNVDDIRIETIPIEGFPPVVPIPVDSWVTILIMISVIGIILIRFR